MRYWEDFSAGETIELGSVSVSGDEIVEFATRFDPQPIHIDPKAAAVGPYGGIIASGWHTGSLLMSLFVPAFLLDSASLGSPGIEELRWLAPVRPGDTLTGRVTIAETWPSEKDPARGTLVTVSEVYNQDQTLVMTLRARSFIARSPAGPAASSGA